MKTGDIWLAQLDPTVGSEIQKTRPCVVISPDDMNMHLRTVIVAPMTTGSRPARFRVALTFQGKQGLIVLDQIRTLIQQFGGRPSNIAEPTDPMTLYRTLAGGHPVIIAIQAPGSQAGHVIVVRGMTFMQTQNGIEPVLHINDPMAIYTQPVPFRQLAQMWKAAIIVN